MCLAQGHNTVTVRPLIQDNAGDTSVFVFMVPDNLNQSVS